MRELHWHPNADEWLYFVEGKARMGVFAGSGQARTFDYQAGDVGYVPFGMGHYVENTGEKPLRFLEMFKSSYYADLSLEQWMALTPPQLLDAHLGWTAPPSIPCARTRLRSSQSSDRDGAGSRPRQLLSRSALQFRR